jgi:hypothetical protein
LSEHNHPHQDYLNKNGDQWWRKYLSGAAFVILTIAVVIALNGVRQEGIHHRQELAHATKEAVERSCEETNNLRASLRTILYNEAHQVAIQIRLHHRHPRAIAQMRSEAHSLRRDAASLRPEDCSASVLRIQQSAR